MKKIFCLILCAVLMIYAFPMASTAAGCNHEYIPQHYEKTCIALAHTTYTCTLCGDTYSVDDPLYELPQTGLYILATETVSGGNVTITVKLGNNPGLWSFKMNMGFNPAAVAFLSVQKGEVFNEGPDVIVYEGQVNILMTDSGEENATSNGIICTFVFRILDEDADWGFAPYADSRFIMDASYRYYSATVVNAIGATKLAAHQYVSTVVQPTCTEGGYTVHTCSVCGKTYTDTPTVALGHAWDEGVCIVEPTLTTEGTAFYTCTRCNATKTEPIPVLERLKKGDVNGDGLLNSRDSLMLKLYLTNLHTLNEFQLDAADFNSDGKVNSRDSLLLKRYLTGYPIE